MLTNLYFFVLLADAYSASSNENGGKSESVANLQPQPSLNSIQSSPGPKRSTNTLKKWLTSPVRRLNSGKADSNIKKQKKVREGRKSFDLGSPKPGDETTPQGDSADEVWKHSDRSAVLLYFFFYLVNKRHIPFMAVFQVSSFLPI